MAHPELYIPMNYQGKVIFGITLMIIVLSIQIIARIKNKKQKNIKKQITRKCIKIDLNEYIVANLKQEFIGQKRMFINELIKM